MQQRGGRACRLQQQVWVHRSNAFLLGDLRRWRHLRCSYVSGRLGSCCPTSAVATSAAGAPPSAAPEIKTAKGTLTIMSVKGEITDAEVKAFQTLYPDVKIKQIDSDPTRLNAMLAAGNPPDLVRDAGTDVTPYIATRGIATDLDDYFSKSKILLADDILPINDVWKWDGTTQGKGARYGIAKDWSQDAMWWYNTQAFSAANLKVPDMNTPITYDELLAMAKTLTKSSGGKTSVYGLFTTSPRMDTIASMAATAGGRILSADLAKADFTSPEAQKALTWLVDAAKAKVGYNAVNPSPDWDGPEYFAGHQVSAQQGYWFGAYTHTTAPEARAGHSDGPGSACWEPLGSARPSVPSATGSRRRRPTRMPASRSSSGTAAAPTPRFARQPAPDYPQ